MNEDEIRLVDEALLAYIAYHNGLLKGMPWDYYEQKMERLALLRKKFHHLLSLKTKGKIND